MADRKANLLVTLVFDENSDIRKQVDTEYEVKSYIRNGLKHAIVGREIKHFVIADDEVINEKLIQERKVGKWVRVGSGSLIDDFRCDCCNKQPSLKKVGYTWGWDFTNYCPNCGAEMKGSENESK